MLMLWWGRNDWSMVHPLAVECYIIILQAGLNLRQAQASCNLACSSIESYFISGSWISHPDGVCWWLDGGMVAPWSDNSQASYLAISALAQSNWNALWAAAFIDAHYMVLFQNKFLFGSWNNLLLSQSVSLECIPDICPFISTNKISPTDNLICGEFLHMIFCHVEKISPHGRFFWCLWQISGMLGSDLCVRMLAIDSVSRLISSLLQLKWKQAAEINWDTKSLPWVH